MNTPLVDSTGFHNFVDGTGATYFVDTNGNFFGSPAAPIITVVGFAVAES